MATRTNDQWLADLQASGPPHEAALADLRAELVRGLPYALHPWLAPDHPQFAALAEDVAQETLLRVRQHLRSFAGRSQFTTWAHKIAVRVALTELRRRHWKDVSLEAWLDNDAAEAPALTAPAPSPETAAEQSEMWARVQRLLVEELTAKQRQALMAVGIKGMPLEEAARRLNTERNALYKLLHDARVRLKRRLAREGLTPAEVLALFESK